MPGTFPLFSHCWSVEIRALIASKSLNNCSISSNLALAADRTAKYLLLAAWDGMSLNSRYVIRHVMREDSHVE